MQSIVAKKGISACLGLGVAGLILGPGRVEAGGHHGRVQVVQTNSVAVAQPQFVQATPVYIVRPHLGLHGHKMFANSAGVASYATAAPATTTYSLQVVPTQAAATTTFANNQAVVSQGATTQATQYVLVPQGMTVNSSVQQANTVQSGQVITLTMGPGNANQQVGSTLMQGMVAESVSATEAPYLTTIFDGNGRGAIGGLIKAALRKFMNSQGDNGKNADLLKQIGGILLDVFVGVDKTKALPDIEKIIASLLTEGQNGGGNGGGNGGQLAPGQYTISGTFTGQITVGPNGGINVNPTPNPQPGATDPSDRDQSPSKSPFGS